MHQLTGAAWTDQIGARVGEGEAGQRRDDDIVTIRRKRPDERFELDERSRLCVQQQQGRLRTVATNMDDVEGLAADLGHELGQIVEPPLHGAPVEALEPGIRQPA